MHNRTHDSSHSAPLFGYTGRMICDEQELVDTTQRIETLIEQFSPSTEVNLRSSLSEMITEKPNACLLAIVQMLAINPSAGERDYLAQILLSGGHLVNLVREGAFRDLDQAVLVCRRVAKVTPALNVDLLKAVWSDEAALPTGSRISDPMPATNRPAVLRALSVVENLEFLSRTLPLLMRIARYSDDAVIRSKATLLASRAQADGRFVMLQIKEPEPRVRANAVEALWGTKKPALVQLFRQIADNSGEHHRVVVNAVIGLYLAGNQSEAIKRLRQWAVSPDLLFRTASAWAMGHLGDQLFLQDLTELSRTSLQGLSRVAKSAKARIEAGRPAQTAEVSRAPTPARLEVTGSMNERGRPGLGIQTQLEIQIGTRE